MKPDKSLGVMALKALLLEDLLKHKDILAVTKNVQEFAQDVKDKHGPTNFTA
jgi:hypothetical protein